MADTADQQHLWYIRQEGEVSGPFPTGQIVQYLVLGRFTGSEEASANQDEWKPISDIDELNGQLDSLPDIDMARRWADERRRDRRYDKIEEREEDDRREDESLKEQISRAARELLIETFWDASSNGAKVSMLVVGAVVLFVGALILLTPNRGGVTERCAMPFAQGVDLSHCDIADAQINLVNLTRANLMGSHLDGAKVVNSSFMMANLQYMELNHAKIRNVSFARANATGVSFRKAKLQGVNFDMTNLSYADFRGAKFKDVDFETAIMTNAIWTDGTVCAGSSVKTCRSQVSVEAEAEADQNQ